MKLAASFILGTRCIFTKQLAISETSIKIKVRLHETLFLILLNTTVIYKTVAWKRDCAISSKLQSYNVGQKHFRKTS